MFAGKLQKTYGIWTVTSLILLHGCFSRFLNWTKILNCAKHLIYNLVSMCQQYFQLGKSQRLLFSRLIWLMNHCSQAIVFFSILLCSKWKVRHFPWKSVFYFFGMQVVLGVLLTRLGMFFEHNCSRSNCKLLSSNILFKWLVSLLNSVGR